MCGYWALEMWLIQIKMFCVYKIYTRFQRQYAERNVKSYFFFFATTLACGSSQARGWNCATATTPSHCRGNARSLTCCATRELPKSYPFSIMCWNIWEYIGLNVNKISLFLFVFVFYVITRKLKIIYVAHKAVRWCLEYWRSDFSWGKDCPLFELLFPVLALQVGYGAFKDWHHAFLFLLLSCSACYLISA